MFADEATMPVEAALAFEASDSGDSFSCWSQHMLCQRRPKERQCCRSHRMPVATRGHSRKPVSALEIGTSPMRPTQFRWPHCHAYSPVTNPNRDILAQQTKVTSHV